MSLLPVGPAKPVGLCSLMPMEDPALGANVQGGQELPYAAVG